MLRFKKPTLLFLFFVILHGQTLASARRQPLSMEQRHYMVLRNMLLQASGKKIYPEHSDQADQQASYYLHNYLQIYPYTNLDTLRLAKEQPFLQFLACSCLYKTMLMVLEQNPHLKATEQFLQNQTAGLTPLISLCNSAQRLNLSQQDRQYACRIAEILVTRSPETLLMPDHYGTIPLDACFVRFCDPELLWILYNATMKADPNRVNHEKLLEHAARRPDKCTGELKRFNQALKDCKNRYRQENPHLQPLEEQDLAYLKQKIWDAQTENRSGKTHIAHGIAIEAIHAFQQKHPLVNFDIIEIMDGQTVLYLLTTTRLLETLLQLLKEDEQLTTSKPNLQKNHKASNSTVLLMLCLLAQNFNTSDDDRATIHAITNCILERSPTENLNTQRLVDGLTPLQACLSAATQYVDPGLFQLLYNYTRYYKPNDALPDQLWMYVEQTSHYKKSSRQWKTLTKETVMKLLERCDRQHSPPTKIPQLIYSPQPIAMTAAPAYQSATVYHPNNQQSSRSGEESRTNPRSAQAEYADLCAAVPFCYGNDPAHYQPTGEEPDCLAVAHAQQTSHAPTPQVNPFPGQAAPTYLAVAYFNTTVQANQNLPPGETY